MTQALYFVLGNISSLLIGFMLGVLIRSSTGAVVAYFVYTFLVPILFGLLADTQAWFHHAQPWIDIQFAQTGLFLFDGTMTSEQWAHIGVTGVVWLLAPLLVGLRLVVRRGEVGRPWSTVEQDAAGRLAVWNIETMRHSRGYHVCWPPQSMRSADGRTLAGDPPVSRLPLSWVGWRVENRSVRCGAMRVRPSIPP